MEIKFELDHVESVSTSVDTTSDDIYYTIVKLVNTQPIFIVPEMVGYVKGGELIFEI